MREIIHDLILLFDKKMCSKKKNFPLQKMSHISRNWKFAQLLG